MARYVERGGEQVFRGPFMQSDTDLRGFVLRADRDRFAALLDRTFTRPTGGDVRVRPLGDGNAVREAGDGGGRIGKPMPVEARVEHCTQMCDRFRLRLVGHPTVINPDAELRAEARANRWPVHDFRSGRKATLIALPTAAGAGAVAGGIVAGLALRRRHAAGR